MSPLEDMPQASEEDEEEDEDDEDEEVELCRADLDSLLRVRGGQGLTNAMAETICPDTACFLAIELNSIIMGNGGRPLNEEEWDRLVAYAEAQAEERDDEDDIAEAVASVWNELASYDVERSWLMNDGSWTNNILNPEEATDVAVAATPAAAASVATSAATKMQAAWRGFRGRLSMLV
jgi:hypothetical protein